jgi:hypothetical protein
MAGLVPAIHVFRRRERPQGSGEVKRFVLEALAPFVALRGLI